MICNVRFKKCPYYDHNMSITLCPISPTDNRISTSAFDYMLTLFIIILVLLISISDEPEYFPLVTGTFTKCLLIYL